MGCHLFNTYYHCYTHNGRTFGRDKNAVGENDFTLLRSFHNVVAGDSICYSTAQGCIENSTLKEMMRRSQLPVGGDSQRPEYHWESAPVSATRDHRSPEESCSKSRRSDACSAKTCSEREKNTHKYVKRFECNQKYEQCSQGEISLSVSERAWDVDGEIRWSRNQILRWARLQRKTIFETQGENMIFKVEECKQKEAWKQRQNMSWQLIAGDHKWQIFTFWTEITVQILE